MWLFLWHITHGPVLLPIFQGDKINLEGATMSTKFDFFVSYRRRAAESLPEDIKEVLVESFEYDIFLDIDTLKNSNNWKKMINDHLPNSRVIIVVLAKDSFPSVSSVDNDEFLYEIDLACKNDMPLITIDYRGFFSAKEYQNIADAKVRDWLNTPTAISRWPIDESGKPRFDKAGFKNDIVSRMKAFVEEAKITGNYLPDNYIDDIQHLLTKRARTALENDGEIDPQETADLFKWGEERFLPKDIISKVIKSVSKEGSQPDTKTPDIIPVPNEPEDLVDPDIGDDEQAEPDYIEIGDMTVARLFSHPMYESIICNIIYYAGKSKATVVKQLKAPSPNTKIKNAVKDWSLLQYHDVLGSESVANARTYGLTNLIINTLLGATNDASEIQRIKDVLNNTRGNTLVRNAFKEEWPNE
jgi:hypothetical protein